MFPLRLFLLLLLVLGATVSGVGQSTPDQGLYGSVEDSVYTAPSERFRMRVPVLGGLGGKIFDTENVVTFSDDVSTYVSIACFPLDRSSRWERDTRGLRDFLAYFFAVHVAPNFEERFSGTTNEASDYSPDFREGSLFVYTLLPGGSAFDARRSGLDLPIAEPLVAKRGNLLFVANECIFIVSAELAERVTQRSVFHKTPQEENLLLRNRLIELANHLQIPAAAPGRRN